MARDPIDPMRAIAELSGLLVAHENMQDVHQEVVQVVRCRIPEWMLPRSGSSKASRLPPSAAMGLLAVELGESQYEQGYGPGLDAGQANEVVPIEVVSTEAPVAGIPGAHPETGSGQSGVRAVGRAPLPRRPQPARPRRVSSLPCVLVAAAAPPKRREPWRSSLACLASPGTGRTEDHRWDRPSVDAATLHQHMAPAAAALAETKDRVAALRQRVAAASAALAETEDKVADTYDRLALTRPHDAARLRSRAAQFRQFAQVERCHAATYNAPPGAPSLAIFHADGGSADRKLLGRCPAQTPRP